MNSSPRPTTAAIDHLSGDGIPEFADQLAQIHRVSLRLSNIAQTFFNYSDADDPRISISRSAETGLKLALGLARLSDRYRVGLETLRQLSAESARAPSAGGQRPAE